MISFVPQVSIRDVAERAGVALGTVSNVLNRPEKVAPATRERVRAVIDDLGFVRNDAARQLSAGHQPRGRLHPARRPQPVLHRRRPGVEQRLGEHRLSVILGNSDDSRAGVDYLDLFEEQRVSGRPHLPARPASWTGWSG